MSDRQRFNSIDGFMPGNQGRHIGFGQPQRPRRPVMSSGMPVRRPVLHGAPATHNPLYQQSQRPNIGTSRTQPRQSYTNFTSYGASRSTGTAMPQSSVPDSSGSKRGRNPGRNRLGKKPGRNTEHKRFSWKKIIKRTAAVSAVFLLLAGGWMGWKVFSNSGKVFGGDSNILGFLNATKLKGEDKGRVNILLAGVSTDDPGHSGANLTDSIMVVSIDTTNKKAFMLSIPRDLWVNIPDYGHAKINAANAYGDTDNFSEPGYTSGGIGLLQKVISENFDMPIHYYAKVNYSAFRDAVNAVGGISVNIQSTDPRGLYDPNISKADNGPLKLPNGVQTLDGQTALNLARARGDPPGDGRYPYGFEKSDFTRTEHQRMMLLALKEKITSGTVITNPLKIGQLFDVVGKNTKTDLQPSEARRLYDLGKQIKANEIQSLSLNDANGQNLLASYRTPDGASALIPAAGVDDFTDINAYLKKALTSDPVVREAARIVILNGGDITGLASKYSNQLSSKGLSVVAVGDAARQEGATVIIDQTTNNTKSGTKARLQQLFPGSTLKTQDAQTLGYPSADIIVVLGTNQQAPQDSSD